MPRIELSHFALPGDRGRDIQCIVFSVSISDKSERGLSVALHDLTVRARRNGLAVDKAALAYEQYNQLHFYGTPDLVEFLENNGVPRVTNTLDI